jgi:hypothetical protein
MTAHSNHAATVHISLSFSLRIASMPGLLLASLSWQACLLGHENNVTSVIWGENDVRPIVEQSCLHVPRTAAQSGAVWAVAELWDRWLGSDASWLS